MQEDVDAGTAVLPRQPQANLLVQPDKVHADAALDAVWQLGNGQKFGRLGPVEGFGEQLGTGGIQPADAEGERFGHVKRAGRQVPK